MGKKWLLELSFFVYQLMCPFSTRVAFLNSFLKDGRQQGYSFYKKKNTNSIISSWQSTHFLLFQRGRKTISGLVVINNRSDEGKARYLVKLDFTIYESFLGLEKSWFNSLSKPVTTQIATTSQWQSVMLQKSTLPGGCCVFRWALPEP